MTLELEGLTHRYGDELAVEDVSFDVGSGELLALLGPSGCGKTTIVAAIAGHLRPTAGRICLRGTDVTDDPPESRRVGVVFQEPTLFPHMTVAENVAYGLRTLEADTRTERVGEYLELVDLAEQRSAYPAALSGGQRRRVELARALAPRPDVLLLDEPLSALDPTLRKRLGEEIARIQRETGVTTLFVTHDQDEAMALADRVVVMGDGRVAAVGEPRTLYDSPPTPFVASFLGRSIEIPATVVETDPLIVSISMENKENQYEHNTKLLNISSQDGESLSSGNPVTCHVRPERLVLKSGATDTTSEAADTTPDEAVTLSGAVVRVVDRGRRYDVVVRTETGTDLIVERRREPPAVGADVAIELFGRDVTLFETTGSDEICAGRPRDRTRSRLG